MPKFDTQRALTAALLAAALVSAAGCGQNQAQGEPQTRPRSEAESQTRTPLQTDAQTGMQTQAELTTASEQSYREADKALNLAYQELGERIGNGGYSVLRQAQRSWLQFRDDQCKFIGMRTRGGSAESMVWYQCLTQMTVDRTAELNRHLNCREGDLTCAVVY